MVFLHEVKRFFDGKNHLFPEENEDYEEKVKIIRCDNAGENKTLEENCAKHFDEIDFEFTSPGNPQQNVMLEQAFATLYSRMRAMMAHAVLHEKLNTGVWSEFAATATKL